MKKIMLNAFLLTFLSSFVHSTSPASSPIENQETPKEDISGAPENSTKLHKEEQRKIRKLDRAKKLLDLVKEEYQAYEAKIAKSSEDIRPKAELALKHAKLEINAVEGAGFENDSFWHIRQARRYINRIKFLLEGGLVKKELSKNKEASKS